MISKEAPVALNGRTAGRILLSSNDVINSFPLGVLYLYRESEGMEFESLCDSMEKTLHFYPALSGRLVKNTSGSYDIICEGNGAQMIRASSKSALDEFDLNRPDLLPNDILSSVDTDNTEK